MNIITNKNNAEVTLSISVDWDEVKEEYKDIVKYFSGVPVKGFRVGAVPKSVIEKMFKKDIENELARKSSTRICRKAILAEELESGSPISISEIQLIAGSNFSFSAHFILMPEFELPDYHNLQLESDNKEDLLNEISEKLLDKTSVTINAKMIEDELSYSDEEDESEEQAWKAAEDRVKLMLILKRIAKQDNIEVDEKDIEERIKQVAEENEASEEEIRDFLLEEGGLSRLNDYLLAESVLEYIIELNC